MNTFEEVISLRSESECADAFVERKNAKTGKKTWFFLAKMSQDVCWSRQGADYNSSETPLLKIPHTHPCPTYKHLLVRAIFTSKSLKNPIKNQQNLAVVMMTILAI